MGSNPTFSVLELQSAFQLNISDESDYGEIPKRLKGLPWKGSRSLIAARGFKSLLLRWWFFKDYHYRTLTNKQQCNPEKFQEKISESVFRTRTKQNSKTVKISQSWFWSGKNFYSRVWSWLRMNAGGVLNTCKSNEATMIEISVDWLVDLVADGWVTRG